MLQNKNIGFLAAIGTAVLWGLSYLSTKVALTAFSPMPLAFTRFLIASIILFLWTRIAEPHTKLQKQHIPRFLLTGVIGISIYFTFENNGINLTNASLASLIIGGIPILAMIADIIFTKSTLTPMKIMSALVSFIGVYLIISTNSLKTSGSLLGYLFMMGAAISWVVFNFLTKPLYKNYSGLAITTYQTIFGTVALFPFVVLDPPSWHSLSNSTIILNILYLAIFCSAIGYFLYIVALKYLGITTTTLFINFIPVTSVTASCILLGEHLSFIQIVGGLCIIASVYMATFSQRLSKMVIHKAKTPI